MKTVPSKWAMLVFFGGIKERNCQRWDSLDNIIHNRMTAAEALVPANSPRPSAWLGSTRRLRKYTCEGRTGNVLSLKKITTIMLLWNGSGNDFMPPRLKFAWVHPLEWIKSPPKNTKIIGAADIFSQYFQIHNRNSNSCAEFTDLPLADETERLVTMCSSWVGWSFLGMAYDSSPSHWQLTKTCG